MNPYDALRAEARAKLNAAFETAKQEYRETLKSIQALETRVHPKPRRKRRSGAIRQNTVASHIVKCIRPSQPFTIDSVLAELAVIQPQLVVSRDHVKRCLLRFKAAGLIQFVGRNDAGGPVYSAEKSEVE